MKENFLNWLQQGAHSLLVDTQRGIEKEGLRTTLEGRISQQPHPRLLGSPLKNPFITTDFSEALLEFVTPVCSSLQESLHFLRDLHSFSSLNFKDEVIWNASMPCHFSHEEEIPLAQFGSSNAGKLKHLYRSGLKYRYGSIMQTLAGIHYNFSLPQKVWQHYVEEHHLKESPTTLRSQYYFNLIINFRRWSWLIPYLFGASPALDASFLGNNSTELERHAHSTYYGKYATSLRMSDIGYTTSAQDSLNVCFNSLEEYVFSLERAMKTPYPAYEKIGVKVGSEYRQINSNIIQIENEYYDNIRPKALASSNQHPIDALRSQGIVYVEIRNIDINPFVDVGLDAQQCHFIETLLLGCFFLPAQSIGTSECRSLQENRRRIVGYGRQPRLKILKDAQEIPMLDYGNMILDQLTPYAELLDTVHKNDNFSTALAAQRQKLQHAELTPSAQLLEQLLTSGDEYREFVLELSKKHQQSFVEKPPNKARLEQLQQQASLSWKEQEQLEAGEKIDFDTFLQRYNSSKKPICQN